MSQLHDAYNRKMVHKIGIEGMPDVGLRTLPIYSDERGRVMKMTEPDHAPIGEVYFASVKRGALKAWHGHSEMTLRYACVWGHVQVGLCDLRPGKGFGKTAMIELNPHQKYFLLTIPPGVWNGFRQHPDSIHESSVICNAASQPHSAHEISRIHPDQFPVPFDWGEYEVVG